MSELDLAIPVQGACIYTLFFSDPDLDFRLSSGKICGRQAKTPFWFRLQLFEFTFVLPSNAYLVHFFPSYSCFMDSRVGQSCEKECAGIYLSIYFDNLRHGDLTKL